MDNTEPIQQTQPISPQAETQQIPPSVSSPKTKWVMLALVLILLVIVSVGSAFYLGKNQGQKQVNQDASGTVGTSQNNSQNSINGGTNQKVAPISTSTPGLESEIHGFPVYSNSTFVAKKQEATCQNGLQFGGTIICGSTSYTWTTPDNYDKVTAFYEQGGWCKGSGTYDNPRSAMSVASCNKNGFIYGVSFKADATKTTISLYIPTPTSQTDTSNWKTYTNSQFGFRFTYPAQGNIGTTNPYDPSKTKVGECGNSITTTPSQSGISSVTIDSLYAIQINGVFTSVTDWVNRQQDLWKPNLSNFTSFSVVNADEAYKNNQVGYSPIAIYRKGNYIFTIINVQQPNAGCVNYDKTLNWDVPNSLKFQ